MLPPAPPLRGHTEVVGHPQRHRDSCRDIWRAPARLEFKISKLVTRKFCDPSHLCILHRLVHTLSAPVYQSLMVYLASFDESCHPKCRSICVESSHCIIFSEAITGGVGGSTGTFRHRNNWRGQEGQRSSPWENKRPLQISKENWKEKN